MSANDEGNYPEGDGMAQQKRIQGICPQGWHLPSDREWSQLEQEIYDYPERYSSYEDNLMFPSFTDWYTGVAFRPSPTATEAHGRAMKAVCWELGTQSNGLSKSVKLGGFATTATSYAENGVVNWGIVMHATASGTTDANCNFGRTIIGIDAFVIRVCDSKSRLSAVRCKKD
jgi:uncharacterized protein (TIGR02145 family)